MAVNPSVLKDISQVVFYRNEPPSTKVLWAKPVGDGTYEFYVYYNGRWNIVTEEEGVTINISDVTGDLSTFNNDAGFITEDDIGDVIEGASAGATALQPSDIADWAKQTSKPSYTASEVGALPDTTKYAGSQSVGGAANKAVSIPFGQVDSTSTATAFTATVDGIAELRNGVVVRLRNGVIASAANCTLNINNLGALPIYFSHLNQRISTHFTYDSTMLFIYSNDRVEGGCWEMYAGYDSNNNDTAYKIRLESSYTTYTDVPSIQLVFEKDNKMLAISSSVSTNSNKVLTTESFNPFGRIAVYTGTGVQADTTVSSGTYWLQFIIDARRAFNISTSSFTPLIPVYLVVVLQSDNSVKLHSDPVTQTLPSTDDGLLYIFLGTAVNGYNLNLEYHHPIYYFKDGAIRQWTNQDTTALKLGTSTVGGTTQGVYLNQGVPAACESYDMWYMKHIAALYGATRNDATGLWSYYYTNCARWDDTQEKIVWDRNIGYDDITDAEMMDMCDHRLHSLQGVYGYAKAMNSRIALHFIGYGNNQGAAQPCAYIGNDHIVTYGYIGQKGGASGNSYFPWHLQDTFLVPKVKNVIGRSGPSGATVSAPAGSLLEYATVTFNANNQTLNFGTCPNIEFVSIMYTLTDGGGVNRTGCTLILHPDVYAKIFDSTNADYALWHKIDLANQARTNPITIQSA